MSRRPSPRSRSLVASLPLVVLALGALPACGGAGTADDGAVEPPESADDWTATSWHHRYDGVGVDPEAAANKDDSTRGKEGVVVDTPAEAAVWEVRNRWTDTDTDEARKPGMAWEANSGLDWDQKFERWIASMVATQSEGDYRTFVLSTPWGKVLPSPVLECAETAIFLRVAFASWYHLPFFMEAVEGGTRRRVFYGHFGAVYSDGTRVSGTPRFAEIYKDYSDRVLENLDRDWPVDRRLAARGIAGAYDDAVPFLGESARAGAYLDEVFLNKRAAYFTLLLLVFFGSGNLADPANTFNVDPKALQPGDVLVERWQRNGIGHTLVVKTVTREADGRMRAELVSGSMPRRQAVWEDDAASRFYFTMDEVGGSATNSDGVSYAALGGGLKRWRVATALNGRWSNNVLPRDREAWISSTDLARLGARPAQFGELLTDLGPESKRDVLLERIEASRQRLLDKPASCSARALREDMFEELYTLGEEALGQSREELDARYRTFEDYVFAPLEYAKSKTCCWNTTTSDMAKLVLDYARERLDGTLPGAESCEPPYVFMDHGGRFADVKAYAEQTGRGAVWRAWSEDEPCAQRDAAEDTPAQFGGTLWCALPEGAATP